MNYGLFNRMIQLPITWINRLKMDTKVLLLIVVILAAMAEAGTDRDERGKTLV